MAGEARVKVDIPSRIRRAAAMLHARGARATLAHIAAAAAVRRRPARVRAWPRFLQVEVSSRCNMACAQCSRSTIGLPAHQGTMSLDLFVRVLEQFRWVQSVTLHGLGEPLLNDHLPAMAHAAKARFPAARVGLNTNGVLLTPASAKALAESGVDEIGVSLDAATAATHSLVRGGGFDRIVDQVERVCASPGRPSIALALVVMEPNVDELVPFIELASRVGADRASFCDLSARWKPSGEDPMAVRRLEVARQNALAAERRAADLGLPFVYTRLDTTLWPGAFIPCFYLWDYPYVTWEGKLNPCCALPYREAALGDLRQEEFRSIWNGPAYREMRRGLTGGQAPPACRGCHHARHRKP